MTFDPDGKVYLVIGDLNRNDQLQNFLGGSPPDDTGVILRVNDDGTIPADNPFFAQGGNLAKYYAYGVRNSFGLAFDLSRVLYGTRRMVRLLTMKSIWSVLDSTSSCARQTTSIGAATF